MASTISSIRSERARRSSSSSIIGMPLMRCMTLFGKREEPIRACTIATVFTGELGPCRVMTEDRTESRPAARRSDASPVRTSEWVQCRRLPMKRSMRRIPSTTSGAGTEKLTRTHPSADSPKAMPGTTATPSSRNNRVEHFTESSPASGRRRRPGERPRDWPAVIRHRGRAFYAERTRVASPQPDPEVPVWSGRSRRRIEQTGRC